MKVRSFIHAALLIVALPIATTRADVVHDWNNSALNAIRALRTPPPVASRNLAILHTAIHDAVNGIKTPTKKKQPLYLVRTRANHKANKSAAAAAAAHRVLVSLFPTQQARFDSEYQASLAAISDARGKLLGVAYGEMVANAILAARADDGSANTVPYTATPAPGIWRPTESFGGVVGPALLPGWGMVKPFGIRSVEDYRPPLPPVLNSQQYADEVNEAKALGALNSPVRSEEQTEIALFWANGAGTATPPGHWNIIAQAIAEDQGLSIEENARLFALLNIALADAAIVCWDCKYVYKVWRPITAIQEADSAGNTAVEQDPTWKPLLFTPPFPEYTSGHSTFSAAAATILANYFGTDDIAFTARSEEFPGIVRSFTSLSQAADESGMSRIYGGIHFMSGNVYGLSSGVAIANYVLDNVLLARKRPPLH